MTTLDDLITPRSIAVVGASDTPTRIGGRPISYFIKEKFQGPIYPINPNRDTVQGLKSYPTLDAVDGDIDFVLVAVPAKSVVDVVRAAAKSVRPSAKEELATTAMSSPSEASRKGSNGSRIRSPPGAR